MVGFKGFGEQVGRGAFEVGEGGKDPCPVTCEMARCLFLVLNANEMTESHPSAQEFAQVNVRVTISDTSELVRDSSELSTNTLG